jgi:hypothetical protein
LHVLFFKYYDNNKHNIKLANNLSEQNRWYSTFTVIEINSPSTVVPKGLLYSILPNTRHIISMRLFIAQIIQSKMVSYKFATVKMFIHFFMFLNYFETLKLISNAFELRNTLDQTTLEILLVMLWIRRNFCGTGK